VGGAVQGSNRPQFAELNPTDRRLEVDGPNVSVTGADQLLTSDPQAAGNGPAGVEGRVHLRHRLGDTLAVMVTLGISRSAGAFILGASWSGSDPARARPAHGRRVTQSDQPSRVLPTVRAVLADPTNRALIADHVQEHELCGD